MSLPIQRRPSSDGDHSPAIEDYVKEIYLLAARDNGPVSTNALADRLQIAAPSVSGMLRKLSERGLVRHTPYHGVQLEPEGELLALQVLRRRGLVEAYLVSRLGLPWDSVHRESDVLEHHLSDRLTQAIAERLGDPDVGPNGMPIPRADGSLPDVPGRPLIELAPSQQGRLVRVAEPDPKLLKRLGEARIALGSLLKVEAMDRGVLRVSVDGRQQGLDMRLARALQVA